MLLGGGQIVGVCYRSELCVTGARVLVVAGAFGRLSIGLFLGSGFVRRVNIAKVTNKVLADGCRTVFFLNAVIEFAAQDLNIFGEGEAKLHGFATHLNDGDFNIVINDNGVANFSCEIEHAVSRFR